MPITNGYATLAELKARLNITDTADDAVLEAVITAASRSIDADTGRQFFATTATRYFTADSSYLVFIDDLLSITSLKADLDGDRVHEDTWSSSDYDLEPYNGASQSIQEPYTRIRLRPRSNKYFPTFRHGVEVVGSWGFAATAPAPVNEACLIQAARLFKRKDAPFGVLGTPELGVVRLPKLDMDVRQLLAPFVRYEVL